MTSRLQDVRAELDDIGNRIEQAIADYKANGLLHGTEREMEAEIRLQHSDLAQASRSGSKPCGELAHDISVLKGTFERWLARLDKRSERRRA